MNVPNDNLLEKQKSAQPANRRGKKTTHVGDGSSKNELKETQRRKTSAGEAKQQIVDTTLKGRS